MKQIAPLISLVLLTLLTACVPEYVRAKQREEMYNAICMERGGDFAKCRAAVVEEHKVCLARWYALPPEERAKIVLQKPETRTPEIRACNALGV